MRTWTPLLLLLLACNGDDPDTTDLPVDTDVDVDTDTDGDTDGDTDTDTDGDTDTDTDTEPPPEPYACDLDGTGAEEFRLPASGWSYEAVDDSGRTLHDYVHNQSGDINGSPSAPWRALFNFEQPLTFTADGDTDWVRLMLGGGVGGKVDEVYTLEISGNAGEDAAIVDGSGTWAPGQFLNVRLFLDSTPGTRQVDCLLIEVGNSQEGVSDGFEWIRFQGRGTASSPVMSVE